MLLFGTMIISSCVFLRNGGDRWESGYVKGLQHTNEKLNQMIFIDDTTGFLFGSNYTDSALLNDISYTEQNTVIYKTTDAGKNWKATAFGKGVFESAAYISDTLYALKNVFYGNQIDQRESSHIFKSTNRGESWKEVAIIPSDIMEIHFYSGSNGIAVSHYEKNTTNRIILKTTDGGNIWDTIPQHKVNIKAGTSICTQGGKLWYLSSNKADGSCNLLIQKDLQTGEEKVEVFRDFLSDVITLDKKENVWLLGKSGDSVTLYYRKSPDEYIPIKNFSLEKPLFAEFLHVYEKSISVIVSELLSSTVIYKMFHSDDMGKSWKEEELPINYLINPLAFYGKDKIWINGGGGRLQWRK